MRKTAAWRGGKRRQDRGGEEPGLPSACSLRTPTDWGRREREREETDGGGRGRGRGRGGGGEGEGEGERERGGRGRERKQHCIHSTSNKKQLPHLSARVRFSSSVSCLATSSATSRGGCGTKGAGPSSERALSVVSRRRALGWERLSVTRESTSGERDGRDLRRETNAWTQDFWTRVKGRDSRIKKGQHLVVPRPSPVRVTLINALARKIALQVCTP